MRGRTAEQLKHLELVQVNIARMHDASTSMKRFTVVAFALGGSLARYLHESDIVVFTMVVIIAFWMLDSKYLQMERSYRALYELVRIQPAGDPASFDLTPDVVTGSAGSGTGELVDLPAVWTNTDPSHCSLVLGRLVTKKNNYRRG